MPDSRAPGCRLFSRAPGDGPCQSYSYFDLVRHIRQQIAEHGDAEASRLLAEGDAEFTIRRTRLHSAARRS
ncbi:hypothetical protein Sru01_64980 [Sphaerisporangium rufum]|uniref:Uncharacterized protein n=1 Tax=Sphaerisporangium rufum TaxID=1381558 RepID=A0A919R8C4_9ACTN|nr:hypothetical protein Sru01_64980 [Sphaerisporangium rufum]